MVTPILINVPPLPTIMSTASAEDDEGSSSPANTVRQSLAG